MSPRAAAAAAARGAAATVHAPARTRPARRPAPARRRSGAAARPAARVAPRFDGIALLDRLLRGPAYIAMIGILLAGIVFFNVDLLELNHGIARTDSRATQLKRQNAALALEVARLGSSERIQQMALQRGLVLPQPGDVRYLRAHREDAARALRVMTAPDPSGAAAAVPALVTQDSTPTAVTTTSSPATQTTTPATTTSTPTTATTTPTTTTTTTPTTAATTTTTTPTTTATGATTQAGAVAAPATP
jgi:cell division protein FtsL